MNPGNIKAVRHSVHVKLIESTGNRNGVATCEVSTLVCLNPIGPYVYFERLNLGDPFCHNLLSSESKGFNTINAKAS